MLVIFVTTVIPSIWRLPRSPSGTDRVKDVFWFPNINASDSLPRCQWKAVISRDGLCLGGFFPMCCEFACDSVCVYMRVLENRLLLACSPREAHAGQALSKPCQRNKPGKQLNPSATCKRAAHSVFPSIVILTAISASYGPASKTIARVSTSNLWFPGSRRFNFMLHGR